MGKSRVKLFFIKCMLTMGGVAFFGSSVAGVLYAFNYAMDARSAGARPASSMTESAAPEESAPVEESVAPAQGDAREEDEWSLLLVNSERPLTEPCLNVLAEVGNVRVDSRAAQSLRDMLAEAGKDGVNIWLSSGYRDEQRQEQLFSKAVGDNLSDGMTEGEAVAVAGRSINPPGCSEHATGLAVDVNGVRDDFGSTKEYAWLQKNAEKFGFVLRYPSDKEALTGIAWEPWHYRYVGAEHAARMNAAGMCLEEYVANLESP